MDLRLSPTATQRTTCMDLRLSPTATQRATSNLLAVLCIAVLMLIKLSSGEQNLNETSRNQEKDFPPRLTHQPPDVRLKPREPHTVECPVESHPESEVKWFKDGQVLTNVPAHLEQTGSELMFFQINEDDTGHYHCEAENHLGRVTSEQFRLTVQSSNGINNNPLTMQTLEHERNRPAGENHTTQLIDDADLSKQSSTGGRIRTSLAETLGDLYQIAKPTLILFGVMCLVAVIVLFQFLLMRRRTQANRYMKHHHQYSSSASSATSGLCGASPGGNGSGSGASGALADCHPVLSSLLASTLSASSANSLSGATKKYKYYRDHMRGKVAAAVTSDCQLVDGVHHDFIDAAAYFAAIHQQQHQHQRECQTPLFAPSNNSAVPNLYNQSLAAREQARSLLQSGEHVRSLGNLTSSSQMQRLEHPLSKQHEMIMSGTHRSLRQQQKQVNSNEQYQLVSCSSISPSSTSSVVAGSNSSSGLGANNLQKETTTSQLKPFSQTNGAANPRDSVSNHYSIIENNEDEVEDREADERYEALDGCEFKRSSVRSSSTSSTVGRRKPALPAAAENARDFNRKSTFGVETSNNSNAQRRASGQLGASLVPNDSSNLSSDPVGNNRLTSAFGFKRDKTSHRKLTQDQLSPYAVSSICHSQLQPPPVSSEAMRALKEQFDINQLVLIDNLNVNCDKTKH